MATYDRTKGEAMSSNQPNEDVVPSTTEGAPIIRVQFQGTQVRQALDDLIAHLAVERTDRAVFLRALGVLHQAIDRRITLTSGDGTKVDLLNLWKE